MPVNGGLIESYNAVLYGCVKKKKKRKKVSGRHLKNNHQWLPVGRRWAGGRPPL